MVDDRAQRRLAAILVADVMAYSRLVGEDEEGTLAALRGHRTVLDELIITHRGRIFGTAGDSVVAEFASAVDAVRAAIDIQRAVAQRSEPVAPGKRLQFRIGINLGDVVVEKDDLLGDGVNIAARLQTSALPGGICVSGAIYDQVHAKLSLPYQYAGEQRFKNIAHPVRIYRVPVDAADKTRGAKVHQPWIGRRRMFAGVALLLAVLGTAGFLAYRHADLSASRAMEDPARHNKAPLLVLPLRNMTGDPQLDGFADGLTDDIVTSISRHPEVFVIAATTASSANSGQSVLDLARANRVRYVLQSNITKAGDQLRVVAQLVDGATGEQLRPETQEVVGTDLATLRVDARRAIAAGLFGDTGALVIAEQRRANRIPETERTAYDLNYLALEQLSKRQKAPTERAIELLNRAIEMEPNYGFAHANLAFAYLRMVDSRWGVSYLNDLEKAARYASRAAAIDGTDFWPQWLLGAVSGSRGDIAQSWNSYQRALNMNPDVAQLHSRAADILVCLGRYDEALAHAELGLRMLKVPPDWMYWEAGWAAYHARDYKKVLETLSRTRFSEEGPFATLSAAAYAQLGRDADAARIRARFAAYVMAWQVDYFGKCFKDNPAGLDHWLEGLRKAGFK